MALQRADRRRLRAGHPYGIAGQSPDGAAARPAPAPGQPDGHVVTPRPELSYTSVNRPLSEQEQERLTARRPEQLIRPIPRHLVPLPTPRRVLSQMRSRLNRHYLLSALEPPYQDGSGDGQSAQGASGTGERPVRDC